MRSSEIFGPKSNIFKMQKFLDHKAKTLNGSGQQSTLPK